MVKNIMASKKNTTNSPKPGNAKFTPDPRAENPYNQMNSDRNKPSKPGKGKK